MKRIRNKAAIDSLEPRRLLATIYVDTNASGTLTGVSWTNAFTDLQQALSVALAGDTIRVADGTYKPTTGTNRSDTFQLLNDVTLEGGYAGGATNPNVRNFITTPSILSGNIGAPTSADNSYHVVTGSGVSSTAILDGFTIQDGGNGVDGAGMYSLGGAALVSNCAFINNIAVTGAGMFNGAGSATTVVNCVFYNNYAANYGGGMRNVNSSGVTVTDCIFGGNLAGEGGGVENVASSVTFKRCLFEANTTTGGRGGGMYIRKPGSPNVIACSFLSNGNNTDFGGGVYIDVGTSPRFDRCEFINNLATAWGGAIDCIAASSLTVTNCVFTRNQSLTDKGGAILLEGVNATITACRFDGNKAPAGGAIFNLVGASPNINNCTFVGNVAWTWGGAIVNAMSSSPLINNCTFADNVCPSGGPGSGGAVISNWDSTATITNSILWNLASNVDPLISLVGSSSISITFSDVWSSHTGTGNIAVNPQFVVDPSKGNDGVWATFDDNYGNVRLRGTSPCIDVGSNALVPVTLTKDQDLNRRIVNVPAVPGTQVDMGAFERQTAFSVSSSVFNVNHVLPTIAISFGVQIDEESLTAGDLNVTVTARPGGVVPVSVSYDPETFTASFRLPATFPDGDYTATLPAGSVIDTAGDPLAADFSFDFFFLAGDANHDGTVNLTDYNTLAANFGQSPRTFSQGDFNYDGQVNLADFNILASRFGTTLGPDGVMSSTPGVRAPLPPRGVATFSTQPIRPVAKRVRQPIIPI